MPQNIMVTGGAGFIGSHLVDAYVNNGHKVVIVDDLSTGKRDNLNSEAKFYEIDIKSPDVEDIFVEEEIDIVNHQAAQASAQMSINDPTFDAVTNIIGTLNLLEICRRREVQKFIFSSSVATYGEQEFFPADESHPQRPVNPYGVAKLSAEKYIRLYFDQLGLDYTIFRYANVYGPRQDPFGEGGVVAVFSQKMDAGEQPLINGDGMQTRDFIYVGDVVEANLLATGSADVGEYNLSTSKETSVIGLFREIKDITGSSLEPKYGPAKKGDQQRSVIDNTKAISTFGWKPKVDLRVGLTETVSFFKERVNI